MGKTRDLFKKIRDIKRNFHAKMGTIKGRNGMDLTKQKMLRRDVKSKEEERYTHLNAEFQRIARRDKKVFLCDQCKETEENNRMGKTRVIFKKIRDTTLGISTKVLFMQR